MCIRSSVVENRKNSVSKSIITFLRISKVPEIINNVKKFVTIESLPLEQTSEAGDSPAPTNINSITEQNRLQDMVETLEVKKFTRQLFHSVIEENAINMVFVVLDRDEKIAG